MTDEPTQELGSNGAKLEGEKITLSFNSCSFCDRELDQGVLRFVNKDKTATICISCNDAFSVYTQDIKAADELAEYKKSATLIDVIPKPAAIKAKLDEYVIGQDAAKRALSNAIHNHYKRLKLMAQGGDDTDIQGYNVLLIGSTGTGKSYMVETLAKEMHVPYVSLDATKLVQTGIEGKHFEEALFDLIIAAGEDMQSAEQGIVFIDEIDKTATDEGGGTNLGKKAQQGLLAPMQGAIIDVPIPGTRGETVRMNTNNILFICGGAFAGLDKIVEERLSRANKTIGFGSDPQKAQEMTHDQLLSKVMPEDLVKYGIISELAGRLHVRTKLHALDESALIRILKEPKNALVKQKQKLFAADNGPQLSFDDEALVAIARRALGDGMGARGLAGIMEDALEEVTFEQPDVAEIRITADVIEGKAKPLYVSHEQKAALNAAVTEALPIQINSRRHWDISSYNL